MKKPKNDTEKLRRLSTVQGVPASEAQKQLRSFVEKKKKADKNTERNLTGKVQKKPAGQRAAKKKK